MAGLFLFGGGWNNHCKRSCGPVMATRLRAESAAGGHDLPWFRKCYGPEFVATALRDWLERIGVRTLHIEPGWPWENGYCESFNSKLRDEHLARETFFDLREAQILIEAWRRHYNTARPHSSLGYRPPAPRTIVPAAFMPPYYGEVAA